MKQILDQYTRSVRQINLNNSTKYQLFFMVSVGFYHSTDYFFKNNQQNEKVSFMFLPMSFLQINTNLMLFIATLYFLNVFAIFSVFFNKKATFMLQILEKVIFPFQIWILVRIYRRSDRQSHEQKQILVIVIKAGLLIITIVSLMLIIVKNFKINLKYLQNTSKSFNRIFKCQFLLLLLKLSISAIFSAFYSQSYLQYVVLISLTNAILNGCFFYKIFYEDPCIQFIALISQVYLWVPIVGELLEIYDVQRINIQIANATMFIVFLIVGIMKPKSIRFLLQKKYLHQMSKLNYYLKSQTSSSVYQKPDAQSKIIFLSIAKILLFDRQIKQLQWSLDFKVQVVELLQKLILNSKLCFQSDFATLKPTLKHLMQQSIDHSNLLIEASTTPSKSSFKNLIFQIQHQQERCFDNLFHTELWQIIKMFIDQQVDGLHELVYYICYNFFDNTNSGKQFLFYAFYLASSRGKQTWFDRLNNQMCHQFLMEKVGFQKLIRKPRQNSLLTYKSLKEFDKVKQLPNQKFVEEKTNLINFCLEDEEAIFNSNFNEVITRNQLFKRILQNLALFQTNQEHYLKLNCSDYVAKSQIIFYLNQRNSLRHETVELIKQYQDLQLNKCRSEVSIVLNFIKDNWLNNDPILAYDTFKQNLLKTHAATTKKNQNLCYRQKDDETMIQKDERKMYCVISAISMPNYIVTACQKFKKLLQVQPKHTNTTFGADQKVNINSLLPQIWQQQHNKLLRSNFLYEKPINHSISRYFMVSHRKSNALDVKFRMYFHMLQEKDLLIVLDVQYEKLKRFIIMDERKDKVLYIHKAPGQSKRRERQKSTPLYNKNKNLNLSVRFAHDLSSPSSNPQNIGLYTEKIQVFGQKYQVHVIKQVLSSNKQIFLHQTRSSIKSQLFQTEEDIFKKGQKLKQLKFYHYKETFADNNRNLFLLLVFSVFFIGFVAVSAKLFFIEKRQSLIDQIYVINDKTDLQVQYLREEINKAIQMGMLFAIESDLINTSLLKPQVNSTLYSHILAQIGTSINLMKIRHAINPYLIRKTIRTQRYYQADWVEGYNKSLEIIAYETETMFLRCIHPFVRIFKVNGTLKIIPRDRIQIQEKSTSLQTYQWLRYLNQVKENQEYYESALGESIVRNFDLSEKVIVENGNNYILTLFIILQIGFVVFVGYYIFLLYQVISKIVKKYNLVTQVSGKFLQTYRQSTKGLQKYIDKLHNFQSSFFYVVLREKKPSYEGNFQPKSDTIYKFNTYSDYTMNRTETYLAQSEFENNQNQSIKLNKYQSDPNSLSFKSFYFDFLKYPILRFLVILMILYFSFFNYKKISEQMEIYSMGLQSLTKLNVGVLNLLSTNLMVSTMKRASYLNKSEEVQILQIKKQFGQNITIVSQTNKINIVNQLFLNQQIQEQPYIPTVLFKNLCSQYPQEMQCPQYMVSKINGLLEKYGQTIKNLNILFHKQIKAPVNSNEVWKYQTKFIDCYQNINELVFIAKMIRKISFRHLQRQISMKFPDQKDRNIESLYTSSNQTNVQIWMALYLVIETIWLLRKLYTSNRIVEQQFLRIGSWMMLSSEKYNDGYALYFNNSQKCQYVEISSQMK